jgi:hypothetical protein
VGGLICSLAIIRAIAAGTVMIPHLAMTARLIDGKIIIAGGTRTASAQMDAMTMEVHTARPAIISAPHVLLIHTIATHVMVTTEGLLPPAPALPNSTTMDRLIANHATILARLAHPLQAVPLVPLPTIATLFQVIPIALAPLATMTLDHSLAIPAILLA